MEVKALMEIKIQPAAAGQRRTKPADESKLVFGKTFSDHMFITKYQSGRGWQDARIAPYENLSLDPAAMVLHYGQGIFEGLKAYRWHNGDIYLFRPEKNMERLNRSARRMCMPEIDVPVADGNSRMLCSSWMWTGFPTVWVLPFTYVPP